jgi:hypothetical protein
MVWLSEARVKLTTSMLALILFLSAAAEASPRCVRESPCAASPTIAIRYLNTFLEIRNTTTNCTLVQRIGDCLCAITFQYLTLKRYEEAQQLQTDVRQYSSLDDPSFLMNERIAENVCFFGVDKASSDAPEDAFFVAMMEQAHRYQQQREAQWHQQRLVIHARHLAPRQAKLLEAAILTSPMDVVNLLIVVGFPAALIVRKIASTFSRPRLRQ